MDNDMFDSLNPFEECKACICSRCDDGYCKVEACQEGCIRHNKAYPNDKCQNE
jgi:hypothetical protein